MILIIKRIINYYNESEKKKIYSYIANRRKNLDNENNTMKKLVGKFIIRSLAMNKKIFKFT